MSLVVFQTLCRVRQGKVEHAEREFRAQQAAAVRAQMQADAARAAHEATLDDQRALAARWRASRLALRSFVHDDCVTHEAEMARAERRIQLSLAALQDSLRRLDDALRLARAAREALAHCRVDLSKAEKGVELQQSLQRAHDEATEEDELDELAMLGSAADGFAELRA